MYPLTLLSMLVLSSATKLSVLKESFTLMAKTLKALASGPASILAWHNPPVAVMLI